jgi:hypothetical protein
MELGGCMDNLGAVMEFTEYYRNWRLLWNLGVAMDNLGGCYEIWGLL